MDDSGENLDETLDSEYTVSALLDEISGAYEDAQLGLQQVREGRTITLDEL